MKLSQRQISALIIAVCSGGITLLSPHASAGPIAAGDILVYRVGTGTSALANTGNAVFIDEYTPAGALVQSIALPTADGGGNFGLVAGGTASSEGLLTISPNGQYLALTGYRSTLGTSLSASNATTVNRTIGIIPLSTGVPSVTTALTDFASASSPRSAVTTNGTDIWIAGGAGGVRYVTAGTVGTSTSLTTLANMRQVNIFNGQLYADDNSTSGGNTVSLGTVGSGLPTSGTQTFSSLPGFPVLGTTSNYAFFLADLSPSVAGVDTLYVADDGALALRKYSLVSGSWTLNGTIGVSADDYVGVTGVVTGTNVQLYATRKGGTGAAGGGELVGLLDSSGYNGAFAGTPTLLASAVTGGSNNTAFRGVAVAPAAPAITKKISMTYNTGDFGATYRGDIVTTGASSQYISTILDLTNNGGNPGFATGNVKITGTLPTPDSDHIIWVLVDSTGGDINSVLSSLSVQTNLFTYQTLATVNHQQFDEMASAYASVPRTWDALLIFDATALDPSAAPGELAGKLNFNWDFTGTGVAIDALVAVPEPASLGLLTFGALGLLTRRRRR